MRNLIVQLRKEAHNFNGEVNRKLDLIISHLKIVDPVEAEAQKLAQDRSLKQQQKQQQEQQVLTNKKQAARKSQQSPPATDGNPTS